MQNAKGGRFRLGASFDVSEDFDGEERFERRVLRTNFLRSKSSGTSKGGKGSNLAAATCFL